LAYASNEESAIKITKPFENKRDRWFSTIGS